MSKPYLNLTIISGGTTITMGKTAPLHILEIDGLLGSEVDLELSNNAQGDGGTVTKERLAPRPLSILAEVDTSQNSMVWYHALRRFFIPGRDIVVHADNSGFKTTNTFRLNSKFTEKWTNRFRPFKFLVDLIAPDPYMKSESEFQINMAATLPMFTAPFAIGPFGAPFSVKVLRQEAEIDNIGDVETGLYVVFSAKGNVENPEIRNLTTGEFMRVLVTMAKGDVLTVNTNRGKHRIELNGISISQKKDRAAGCTYFQLQVGKNILKYGADQGYVNLDVVPRHRYEYYGG